VVNDDGQAEDANGPERGGRWLVALEAVFVLVIVGGVALVHVPGALVLGGVLGVLACERALARRQGEERVPGVGRGGEAAGGERQ
jgi:predicted LPLAT superfamily acyltransferase